MLLSVLYILFKKKERKKERKKDGQGTKKELQSVCGQLFLDEGVSFPETTQNVSLGFCEETTNILFLFVVWFEETTNILFLFVVWFSPGIILYEVATRKRPYHEHTVNPIQLMMMVLRGARPTFVAASDAPEGYVQLAENCWDGDFSKRPSFTDVVGWLQALFAMCES